MPVSRNASIRPPLTASAPSCGFCSVLILSLGIPAPSAYLPSTAPDITPTVIPAAFADARSVTFFGLPFFTISAVGEMNSGSEKMAFAQRSGVMAM